MTNIGVWQRSGSCGGDLRGLCLPDHAAAVLRRPGERLDPDTRRFMESRFGRDLGDIRVHRDSAAARSAQALSARAYTVGTHIAFGPAAYAIRSTTGRERLAHEITHALQQRQPGGPNLGHAQREGEARRAAESLATGAPMPRISAASRTISRDPVPGAEDDAEFQATLAEGSCDIGALCRLSHQAPEIVTRERLLRSYRHCHPAIPLTRLIAGNPCLTPNFGLPPPAPVGAAGPRRTPGPPPPGAARGPAGAGGLSLPSTTLQFNLGAAAVTVDLPSSVAVRLPVPFRGAQRVVFALNASPSEFSFRVTVNAVPHVRIIASASLSTSGRGAAGLTVQTTRTTCRAVDPAAARSALERAGTRLHDAIQAVQNPPAPAPDAGELETTFAPQARLAEVVGAVANLKSTIDRVGAPCREVPVASFEFGAQGQLTETEEAAGGPRPATFVGGSLRLHF